MIEFYATQVRGHRRNIERYCRLLTTDLTDLERQYLHKRIAEEHAQLERLERHQADYSGDLAVKHAADFRAVINAEWYRRIFPAMRISPEKNTLVRNHRYYLEGRGCRLCRDPHRAREAIIAESRRHLETRGFGKRN